MVKLFLPWYSSSMKTLYSALYVSNGSVVTGYPEDSKEKATAPKGTLLLGWKVFSYEVLRAGVMGENKTHFENLLGETLETSNSVNKAG